MLRRSTINTLPKSDFISQLQKREKVLNQEIEKRRKRLKNAPEGSLRIVEKGNTAQYYLGNKGEKKNTYIKRSDAATVLQLAQKKYDMKFIREAESEIKKIHRFLNSYEDNITEIFSMFPQELKDKIDGIDMSDSDYMHYWEKVRYEPKPIGENVPYHITLKGERVRSKSEEIIANALFSKKILYRYECPVRLNNGHIVHPDFKILDIRNRREVYWEHLGKIDDPDYVNRNMWKFREYESSGINLGRNLLVTYETEKDPINSRIVEVFIETHFGR
ncbi:hypothetical protein [Butyrivibrio sp. VCD2006]|uniref:hypothetical protein n=1 Tax=Butyrivibrio sp. VCD2006 TaxID=1280664 RepID=UPI000428C927|nr:hypothetical protein [Butyrivibrio sp. VCD2006]